VKTYSFDCPVGHSFELEDTGDQASLIALRQTRKRVEKGCDTPVGSKVLCGLPVAETVKAPPPPEPGKP